MADSNDLPKLDPDIARLLDEAKSIPELDPAKKAALFARVSAGIGAPPSQGPEGGGGAPPADPIGAGSALVTSTARAVIALGSVFALGIGAGVAIDRAMIAPAPASPPASVAAPAPSTPPSVMVTNGVEGISVASLPDAPSATALPARGSSARPEVSARGLAAERALLDVARGALARGEATAALDATDRHAKEYPAGALVEEREAIAIKALVALGRHDDARKRAAAFERRFPNGLLLRGVKSAVEGAP